MIHSENLDKIAPALVALQADLQPVGKSAENPFFRSKYAPLPAVLAALQPLLSRNHLALTVFPSVIDGINGLAFLLVHSSGQYISGEWLLTPAKKDPQGEGSDTTYKRRYGVMAITGLVADGDDDDGQAASVPPKRSTAGSDGSRLGRAKSALREAVQVAGVDASQYSWVANATEGDAEKIENLALSLTNGKK